MGGCGLGGMKARWLREPGQAEMGCLEPIEKKRLGGMVMVRGEKERTGR